MGMKGLYCPEQSGSVPADHLRCFFILGRRTLLQKNDINHCPEPVKIQRLDKIGSRMSSLRRLPGLLVGIRGREDDRDVIT